MKRILYILFSLFITSSIVTSSIIAQPNIRRPLTGLESAPDTLMIPISIIKYADGKYDLRYDYLANYIGTGSGDFYHVLQDTITQTLHGFVLNNTTTPFIPVRYNANSGLFERASTSAAADLPWTNVVEIIDENNFVCQPMGPLWNRAHTLTTGNFLFLQDDGNYNSIDPDADYDVVIASTYDNNNIWLYDNRPLAGSGSGGLNISNARNGVGLVGDTLEFGFPFIRNTQVQGNNNSMLWTNVGSYTVESNAQVDFSSGATSEINLNGGLGIHLNSPRIYVDQRPQSNENAPLIMVWDSTDNIVKIRRDINLPFQYTPLANEALSINNDTIQFGLPSRPGQEFTNSRIVTPQDTSSYIEFYDDAVIGRDRFPLHFASEGFPENGHYGILWENIATGALGRLAMTNNTMRLDGQFGVQLTYDFEARFAANSTHTLSFVPFFLADVDLSSINVFGGRGALAVSDGTRSGTIENQLYYFTENEGEVELSVKNHSDMVTEFDVPLSVAETQWCWTVPPSFDNYRLMSVEHSFVTAGTNDATITVLQNGLQLNIYSTILSSGNKTAVGAPVSGFVTLIAGQAIRGRVTTLSAGTPAEGWTINLKMSKL
jgi:hypothetical protein